MKKHNKVILLICLIIGTQLIGFLSSTISGDIAGKYLLLNKPPLSPPSPVFGIVWPILYLLMAVAFFIALMSTNGAAPKIKLSVLYGAQLLLNFFWSIVFFRGDAFWPAFALILVLDLAVLLCLVQFYRHNKIAAFCMLPYFLWILFASYLNIGVAMLN